MAVRKYRYARKKRVVRKRKAYRSAKRRYPKRVNRYNAGKMYRKAGRILGRRRMLRKRRYGRAMRIKATRSRYNMTRVHCVTDAEYNATKRGPSIEFIHMMMSCVKENKMLNFARALACIMQFKSERAQLMVCASIVSGVPYCPYSLLSDHKKHQACDLVYIGRRMLLQQRIHSMLPGQRLARRIEAAKEKVQFKMAVDNAAKTMVPDLMHAESSEFNNFSNGVQTKLGQLYHEAVGYGLLGDVGHVFPHANIIHAQSSAGAGVFSAGSPLTQPQF